MGEATSNAAPYTARKMLTHVWTSSSWMSARSVKANGKTGTTVYKKKEKVKLCWHHGDDNGMLRIRPGLFKRSGEKREKKRTDSISENVRKHCRGDHDDDESFAAPEM